MEEQNKSTANAWKDFFGSDNETNETTKAAEQVTEEASKPQEEDVSSAWKQMFQTDVGLKSVEENAEITEEQKQENLNKGLEKTKRNFFQRISRAVAGKATVDLQVLDDIEEALISSDVSLDTTIKIIDRLEARVAKDKYFGSNELNQILKSEIVDLLSENNTIDFDDFVIPGKQRPYVMMIVGVNGVGKTTTIGKLAYHFKERGHKVMLGAADTFRAAAVDQLDIWAHRTGVDIVKKEMGSDPSSVAFDTLASAKSKGSDIVLIDTAGRLHNKKGLMEELAKIKRVMDKQIPDAPHDVMLVLDGSTGQNALEQAKQFSEFTQVTSMSITKLDGTAKGGVVIAIADQMKIPIRYIGVGEKAQQLQVFNKAAFVDTLFA